MDTIRTGKALIETPSTQPFTAGGPSSSQQLNDFRDAVVADLAELDRRTSETAEDLAAASSIFALQAAQLASRFQSMEARLPTVAGRYMADFFTADYVATGNEADVSTLYGQATLPVLHRQEKLVGEDSRGRVWIPKSSRISYSYKDTEPDEPDWLVDENATRALDGRPDTAWWRERPGLGNIWVRVEVPSSLNASRFANCVTLHPFPALQTHLMNVAYRQPDGTWSEADLTYLEGWSSADHGVLWAGNVRLFIPNVQMTELRIRLNVENGGDPWGFAHVGVSQVEFQPTATLLVDFQSFAPGTLQALQLFGKDTDTLSYLATQINGKTVAVALTQNTGNASPVLTAIEARE